MQAQPSATRRQVAGAAAVLLASALSAAAPAQAFLGFGGDSNAAAEAYTKDTVRAGALQLAAGSAGPCHGS